MLLIRFFSLNKSKYCFMFFLSELRSITLITFGVFVFKKYECRILYLKLIDIN